MVGISESRRCHHDGRVLLLVLRLSSRFRFSANESGLLAACLAQEKYETKGFLVTNTWAFH